MMYAIDNPLARFGVALIFGALAGGLVVEWCEMLIAAWRFIGRRRA